MIIKSKILFKHGAFGLIGDVDFLMFILLMNHIDSC